MLRARLVAALSIPFGFVAGHVVGYGFGHLDSADRAVAEAGHEYLSSLRSAALPLLLLSLLFAVLAGAQRRPLRPRFAPTALQLAAVFTAVELTEHLAAGWPIQHVLSEPSLWLGLLTQLAVAGAVVVAIRLLVRVGSWLVAEPAPAWRSRRLRVIPAPALATVDAIALTSIRRRGPPVPFASP